MDNQKPTRIQRKRTKGWKMPENTVYVGRGTFWGNPYKIGETYYSTKIDAEWAVRLYEAAIANRDMALPFVKEQIKPALQGKNLACFCPIEQPCHADILLKVANG